MATTRIIPMHINKGKTIAQCLKARVEYVKNPDKRELSPIHVFKHKELSAQIAEKTEDIEELKTRRASILRRAGCNEDAGGNELQKRMATIEGMLQKLDEQERRFSELSEQTMQKYADLQRQAAQVDADKLNAARQSVRTEYQDAAKKKLKDTFGERYSLMRMIDSRKRVEKLLKEYAALEVIAENRNIQRAIGHHDSEKEHQCCL